MSYLNNVLIGLDQLGNAILGGSPDETISARAYRKHWPIRMRLINWLFQDPNHCRDAFWSEKERNQLPKEYR
jgi:hypothetical protein